MSCDRLRESSQAKQFLFQAFPAPDGQDASLTGAILFWSRSPDYGFLSNFAAAPFVLDGLSWRTVEHCYQAHKFVGQPLFNEIRQAPSAVAAKKLGQNRDVPIPEDWNGRRVDLMRRAMYAKFTQNPELKAALLATGQRLLLEDRADPFWGRGTDNRGGNRLGLLLMELREALVPPISEWSHEQLADRWMGQRPSMAPRLPGIQRRVRFPPRMLFQERAAGNLPRFVGGVLRPVLKQMLQQQQGLGWSCIEALTRKMLECGLNRVRACPSDETSRTGLDHGIVRVDAASHRSVVVYGVRAPDDFQSLAVRYSFLVESPGGGGFAGLAVHCGQDDPTPIFAVIRCGKHSVSIGLSRSPKAPHGWDVAASIRSSEGTSTKSADWVEVFRQAQQLLAKLMRLPNP